jgi:hypothetical protein
MPKITPHDFGEYWARRKGTIPRQVRSLDTLRPSQRTIAEEIQDRYQLDNLEQIARYLDWYMAYRSGWIDRAQFEAETGIEAPR